VPLFQSLDRLEKILTGKDYLVGDVLTEADIRLWVTIVNPLVTDFVLLLMCGALLTDSLRSRLRRSFQVQPAYHSEWVPCYPFVRLSMS
jgi:glutathione S-transferase